MYQDEFVHGSGRRKTSVQRLYERIDHSHKKLKEYREKVEICGAKRNSFSKTDHDATFMRIKKDYMGNDQLLPAYNVQRGSVTDISQFTGATNMLQIPTVFSR